MKIDFEGKVREVEPDDLTNKQAEKIRKHTGLSVHKWLQALTDTDADDWESSFDALYWLMLQQNGEAAGVPIADVDYQVFRFMEAFVEAVKAEAAAAKAAEPDPTPRPAGSARSPAPASRKSTQATGEPPDG